MNVNATPPLAPAGATNEKCVAGPAASEGKPAGLVFVAVTMPGSSRVIKLDEDRGREANRANAVHSALALVAGALEEVLRETIL